MSFLTATELKSHIYDYQVTAITEADSTIANTAISTAIAEVKSYLATRYDVASIFGATGSNRSDLVLDLVKSVAVYKLIRLANPDILYERYHDAYLEAIDLLKQIASGAIAPDLPLITTADGSTFAPLSMQSNPKFHHDF